MRSRIICGPFWGSFAVSGSFAVGDHLRYCTESFTSAFLKSKKPSRLAYQKLVELKCNYKISSQEKWSKVFPEARDLIWQNSYMTAFKCTKSTKLTEFQFRFLHQTLATNVSLVKMGYKDDIRHSLCHEEAENSGSAAK